MCAIFGFNFPSNHDEFNLSSLIEHFCAKEWFVDQERLLSPSQLSEAVGISVGHVRRLMARGEIEFVEISPKVRRLTLSAWRRFQERATKAPIVPGGTEDGHE